MFSEPQNLDKKGQKFGNIPNGFSQLFFCAMPLKRKYDQVAAETQTTIAADYQLGVRGHRYKALATKYNLPRGTVQHIIGRARNNNRVPFSDRGHKRRKLNPKEEEKMLKTLRSNPSVSNRQLAASVGNKVRP